MTQSKARRLAGPMSAELVSSGLIRPEARQTAFETIARTLFEKTQSPTTLTTSTQSTDSHGREQQN